MLRTYYDGSDGGEGNRRFREYTEVSNWYTDVADCLVRNDCELFKLGDDSHRIFDTLPEIAGCTPRYNTCDPNNITEVGPWVDYFPGVRTWKLSSGGMVPSRARFQLQRKRIRPGQRIQVSPLREETLL
ncbi:hypothetical protein BJX62DRAFT_209753 [Aspergillus germanicus]